MTNQELPFEKDDTVEDPPCEDWAKGEPPVAIRLRVAKRRVRALARAIMLDPDEAMASALEAWLDRVSEQLRR